MCLCVCVCVYVCVCLYDGERKKAERDKIFISEGSE